MPTPIDILVTGGTGYIGQHLVPLLVERGHRVRVLAREQSKNRVPRGATPVLGDALDGNSVLAASRSGDTIVHLVGTPHPTPTKADQFEKVDLVSIRATVDAGKRAGIAHLVYVSVAHPAPIMQAYLWVRTLGETMIREAKLTATIVRPWYVLGPGRQWPKLIVPLYKIAEMIPATRGTAERLGLVTLEQMIKALAFAVENPPERGQQKVVDVPAIQSLSAIVCPTVHNIFANALKTANQEEFLTLFENASCKIERIVSHSHASPGGFWYDQETDEWVIVLRGSAVLEFEGGEAVKLKEGDYLTIAKHVKHRVASTSEETVWLAVHAK